MRSARLTKQWLLPARASSILLFFAVGTMCYLAAISLGTGLLLVHAVDGWTQEISSRASLRIDVLEGRDTQIAAQQAARAAERNPNVIRAAPLSREEIEAILEPWLDTEELGEEFELPAIVNLRLRVYDKQVLGNLVNEIQRQVPGVVLETHDAWRERLEQTRRWTLAVAFGVPGLIAAVAITVMLLATHVVFTGNRPVIELLHLLGARNGDIARAGRKRTFVPCLCASVLATLLALATFEAVARADTGHPLLETAANREIYAGWLALVPVASILIARISVRIALIRSLARLSRT
ncbi:MAG: hypothetical protein OXF24_06955 [Hyphomicrobiales bacterium]|nr:hypothetical protein [Hyphomicrobiales bacterium]MCY4049307.1 hypothetical protein [Hyphomicrobiales bacterium]MCY4053006.1 hypothetical protein [Hyphomicrobiales bacterium]